MILTFKREREPFCPGEFKNLKFPALHNSLAENELLPKTGGNRFSWDPPCALTHGWLWALITNKWSVNQVNQSCEELFYWILFEPKENDPLPPQKKAGQEKLSKGNIQLTVEQT